MRPPCRDGSSRNEPLELADLPLGHKWDGRIAYLDRDGVLNSGSSEYINSPEEVKLLPGAANAVAELRRSGFRICIVTNQSPIGRGHWGHERLGAIHDRLRSVLLEGDDDAVIDLILYSPYAPWEGSWARKPNPGMLEAGRQLFEAVGNDEPIQILYGSDWSDRPSEEDSIMVGDRSSDIDAGDSFGVHSIRCDPQVGLSGVIDEIIGDGDV